MKNGVPDFGFSLSFPEDRPITNEEILNSYVRFGVWMRYAQAYEQVCKLKSTDDAFSRLLATATFYSATGALVEDVAATLVAWLCWKQSSAVSLADMLNKSNFRRERKAVASPQYLDEVIAPLIAGKRSNIDIACLADSLSKLEPVEVLRRLGIDWKKVPSVKTARPGLQLELWQKLPAIVGDLLRLLAGAAVGQIGNAYNKIKHGPQINIVDLKSYITGLGLETNAVDDAIGKIAKKGLKPETLCILFEGSSTRLTTEDGTRSTLCLDDDTEAIATVFSRVVHPLGKGMWLLGMWLRQMSLGAEFEVPPDFVAESERLVGEIDARVKTRRVIEKASRSGGKRNDNQT